MMLLGWLISFYCSQCALAGAGGIQPPGVVDFVHLRRMGHSEVLVAPAGFAQTPDIVAPVYDAPPAALFAALKAVGDARARTFPLDAEPAQMQAAWVIRSAGFNFPDVLEIAVLQEPDLKSSFVLYAHALYGISDYGVNRGHAEAWLNILNMKVDH